MPKKKKPDSRGSSPEKPAFGGVTNDQYGSETSSWIEVSETSGSHVPVSRDAAFNQLQEVFQGTVEGEVIYMVLAESNWKADEALEKLLSMVPHDSKTESRISLKNVAQSLKLTNMMSHQHNLGGGAPQISMVHNQQTSSANIPIPGQGHQHQKLRSRLPSVPGKDGSPIPQEIETLSPRTPQSSGLEFVPFQRENMADNAASVQSAMEALDSYASGLPYMSQYGHIDMGLANMYLGPNDSNHNQVNATNARHLGNFVTGSFPPDISQPPPSKGMGYSQVPGMVTVDVTTAPHEDNYYVGNMNSAGSPGMIPNAGYPSRTATSSSNALSGYQHAPNAYLPNTVTPTPMYATSAVTGSKTSTINSQNSFAPMNPGQPMNSANQFNNSAFAPANVGANPFGPGGMPPFNQPPPPLPQRQQNVVPQQQSTNALQPPAQNRNTVPTSPSFRAQRMAEKETEIQQVPNKKGKPRKPAISLDQAERESLEQLIEEVIIGGVGEDIMGDGNTTSSDEDETDKSSKKEKKDGKQHPSHLKVAAKHMKNLPPRFLRRLQVAQKQGEIRLDTQPEGMQQLNMEADEEEEEAEKEDVQQEKDLKKPKKKRNLLESLDPYFDDFVMDDKLNGRGDEHRPAPEISYTTTGYDHHNMQDGQFTNAGWTTNNTALTSSGVIPTAMTCEDLEREMIGTNNAAGMMMASQLMNDKKMQFSVNAPEFIPRTFAPVTSVMSNVTKDSQNRIGSPGYMKPGSPFHTPVGRMSPQVHMPPGQVPAVQLTSQGGPSPTGSPGPAFLVPKVQPPAQGTGNMQPLPYGYPPVSGFPPFRPGYPPPRQGPYPPMRPFMPPNTNSNASPWSSVDTNMGNQLPSHKYYQGQDRTWPGQQVSPGSQSSRHEQLVSNPEHYHKNIPTAQNMMTESLNGGSSAVPVMHILERGSTEPVIDKIIDAPESNNSAIINTKINPKEMLLKLLESGKKVMVLLRGVPGSGKSSLAKELQFNGVTLSTDDFFYRGSRYEYDAGKLSEAHDWNQRRAKEAVEAGTNPIVIDNTNVQAWEMKAYVALAKRNDYHIEILEPDTPWKFKAKELVKRNTHGVPLDTIQRMIDRFEHNVSVESLLPPSLRSKTGPSLKLPEQPLQQPHPQPSDGEQQAKKSHKKKKRKRKRAKKNTGTEGRQAEEDSDDEETTPERDLEQPDSKQDKTVARKALEVQGESSASRVVTEAPAVSADGTSKTIAVVQKQSADAETNKADVKETVEKTAAASALDSKQSTTIESSVSGNETTEIPKDSTETDLVSSSEILSKNEVVNVSTPDPTLVQTEKKPLVCYDDSSSEDDQIREDPPPVEVRKSLRRTSVRKYSCDIKSVEPESLVEALENVMTVVSQKSDSDQLLIEDTIKEQLLPLDAPDLIKEEIEDIIMSKIKEGLMASREPTEGSDSLENVAAFPGTSGVDPGESTEVSPTIDLEEEYQEYLKQKGESKLEAAYWSTVDDHDPYQISVDCNKEQQFHTLSAASLAQFPQDLQLCQETQPNTSLLPVESEDVPKPKREQKRGNGKRTGQVSGNISIGQDQHFGSEWQLALPAQVALPDIGERSGERNMSRVDKSTYTHPKDFSVVINVTQENLRLIEEDNMEAIRKCRARDILVGVVVEEPCGPSQKLMVDKSCWTDFEPLESVDKTEVLRQFFPSISAEDLSHILHQCGGDVEWAVNILLDSGMEYNEPRVTRPSTVAQCVENQPEPVSSTSSDANRTIAPLAILCHKKLDTSILLARDEVQEDLVKGSVRRLQSIEEYRRTSMSESEVTSPASDKGNSPVNRERMASLSLAEESCSAAAAERSINAMDDMGDEYVTDASQMSLTLSPALANQLISMFGPVGFHISPDSLYGDDLALTLNRKTARQIHRRWALTLKEKFQFEEEAIKTMIQEDEALARKLQQEEDEELAKLHAAEFQPPAGPVMPALNAVRTSPPPASLQEIMDEEQAIAASRMEYMTQINTRNREDTLATKMKRMKLLEMFPKVDPVVLEEIYSANGYSLSATAAAIKGSDLEAEAQIVMSPEAIAAYEQELLEQAKQESLSLNQWPGTEEDDESDSYQTLDDPTYQDLRAEASLHYKLRHECFQKAQQAFGSNKKMVASFYSQQGHLHTVKLKAANKRAAEKMLQLRHGSLQQTNTLDLHGLHVDEALDILNDVLAMKETEPLEGRRDQHLTIVTGRGTHSRGGVAKIKPAVITFLQRNNYHFTEPNPGLIKILLKFRD